MSFGVMFEREYKMHWSRMSVYLIPRSVLAYLIMVLHTVRGLTYVLHNVCRTVKVVIPRTIPYLWYLTSIANSMTIKIYIHIQFYKLLLILQKLSMKISIKMRHIADKSACYFFKILQKNFYYVWKKFQTK